MFTLNKLYEVREGCNHKECSECPYMGNIDMCMLNEPNNWALEAVVI